MTGKRGIAAALLLAFALAGANGCGRGERAEESGEKAPRDATMADYPRVMATTRDRARSIEVLLPLQQSAAAFAASEGRYPRDLQELVSFGYLGAVPEAPAGRRIRYNPADGTVVLE